MCLSSRIFNRALSSPIEGRSSGVYRHKERDVDKGAYENCGPNGPARNDQMLPGHSLLEICGLLDFRQTRPHRQLINQIQRIS